MVSVGRIRRWHLPELQAKFTAKASTLGEHMKRAVMPNTINVIGALTHSILGLTSTKTTELVQRTAGPAPPAAATLGCCKASSQQAAQPTAMPIIPCACGQVKSEMIYASGHNYSYGNWMQYSSAQHQRFKYCMNCGSSDYEYGAHSLSYGSWSRSSSTQHSRSVSCGVCGYSTTETGSHSYSYGSWSRYDDTQHRRTKSCSACGDSSYEYADHVDTDGDGNVTPAELLFRWTVTWDAGSNGGTIDGKASFSETMKPNSKPTAPREFLL